MKEYFTATNKPRDAGLIYWTDHTLTADELRRRARGYSGPLHILFVTAAFIIERYRTQVAELVDLETAERGVDRVEVTVFVEGGGGGMSGSGSGGGAGGVGDSSAALEEARQKGDRDAEATSE